MKSIPVNNAETDFVARFNETKGSASPSFLELKLQALNSFEKLGFPSTKNEDWKYTSIAPLLKHKFNHAPERLTLTLNDIKYFLPEDGNSVLLVFENGNLNKELSRLSTIPSGLTIGTLNEFRDHPSVKEHFGKIASAKEESFVALNTALFQQGAFVHADKNVKCDVPVHLLFVSDARQSAVYSNPRNLVVASAGSSIFITESYHSINAAHPAFCNPVTEIVAGDGASIEFVKSESENANDFHIDYTSASLRKEALLKIHTITSGGSIVRNNLRVELQDRNANAILNGLYVTSGETHVDNHSFVDHASPDCFSNELYKGVLDGKSQGVFNGRIYVRKDAQKTNAYQSNKNILLSDQAGMTAKPQLEIYADDVKCSHGATTGQLDEEALFYLRSRGIGEHASRALLTIAFAEEILDRISLESHRDKLKDAIHSKLTKGDR